MVSINENKQVSEETFGFFLMNFMQQKCHVCGQTKPLDNFAKDISTPAGWKYVCKECFNGYQREKHESDLIQAREAGRLRAKRWYEKDPEHAREKARINSAKYRQKIRCESDRQ